MTYSEILNQFSAEKKLRVNQYIKTLNLKNVPLIFDLEHFRRLLGMNEKDFSIFEKEENLNQYYRIKKIKKKNKSTRLLALPSLRLKMVQKWILHNILYTQTVHEKAHGFIKNKSIKTNASQHINCEIVLCLDISSFFDSIKQEQVIEYFMGIGYTPKLSNFLAKLVCFDEKLPQGAPTSPYLSNLIFYDLDIEIDNLCRRKKLNYSRYADDLTISGKEIDKKIILEISNILVKRNFFLNNNKTRFMYKDSQQLVTGVLVNKKLNLPKKYRNNLRQEMYFLENYGLENHLKKRKDIIQYSNYKDHMYGKVNFLKMFDFETGTRYLEVLNNLDWN